MSLKFTRGKQKFLVDVAAWTLTVPIAFYLRLERETLDYLFGLAVLTAIALVSAVVLSLAFRFFRQSWHVVSIHDIFKLVQAVAIHVIVLSAAGFFFLSNTGTPRSIPLISGMLILLVLGGMRIGRRRWYETARANSSQHNGPTKRVLVVGAGEAGALFIREMQRHRQSDRIPVGFLDDDPNKRKQTLFGISVLGKIDDLEKVVRAEMIDEVLIAIPSASGKLVRRVHDRAKKVGVEARIVPSVYDLLVGKMEISQTRQVAIEDLLKREPIQLDLREVSSFLEGKIVLVTGAGGSIGSEICNQVARFNAKQILLLGRGENSIYDIDRKLRSQWPDLSTQSIIADVRDRDKLEYIFAKYRPDVVFHAAAHKHVPLMEFNPDEAVFNNIGGTRNLVELSLDHGVQRFVNISTDKAVNPSSIMGASKRVSEYVVESASRRAKQNQLFISVRFGNVLGSRGSVIPLFKEQVAKGGPITITHPDMTRYFMTIPEATQLVLQAAGIAKNGEVCVLDMGEPVKIVDLAKDLIELSGYEVGTDIDIIFTGVRPGEKLFEELLTAEEGTNSSSHEKIAIARKKSVEDEVLRKGIQDLFEAAAQRNYQRIHEAFKQLIPTYRLSLAMNEMQSSETIV